MLFRSAMPELANHYTVITKQPLRRSYTSKQRWSLGDRDQAEAFHHSMALRLINFGGQRVVDDRSVQWGWRYHPNCPMIPTMSASLLLSSVIASLARYRANVLDAVENSDLNLLCELFTTESDAFVIPTFRNLLYGEPIYVYRTQFT